jgi:hypothetical protein
MTPEKWTNSRTQHLLELHARGFTDRQIALLMNLTYVQVLNRRKRLHLRANPETDSTKLAYQRAIEELGLEDAEVREAKNEVLSNAAMAELHLEDLRRAHPAGIPTLDIPQGYVTKVVRPYMLAGSMVSSSSAWAVGRGE